MQEEGKGQRRDQEKPNMAAILVRYHRKYVSEPWSQSRSYRLPPKPDDRKRKEKKKSCRDITAANGISNVPWVPHNLIRVIHFDEWRGLGCHEPSQSFLICLRQLLAFQIRNVSQLHQGLLLFLLIALMRTGTCCYVLV